MSEFIFKGRGKANRTEHERIAMRNIRQAINWIVGGYYNDFQDDNLEYVPNSREDLEIEIYNSAMVDRYAPGYCGTGKAPKEMRFAGSEFCHAYLKWKLDQDGDVAVLAEAKGW